MSIIRPKQISSASYTISGSFSGSFQGDGSNLTGVGLGYAIVSGSVTASVNVQDTIFLIKSGSSTFFTVDKEGSTTISGSADSLLLVKSVNNINLLNVSQSGVIVMATQSVNLNSPAPNGGLYFTSSSLFIGLD
jgi:hypothetical protein